jgi:hypothetical protein
LANKTKQRHPSTKRSLPYKSNTQRPIVRPRQRPLTASPLITKLCEKEFFPADPNE